MAPPPIKKAKKRGQHKHRPRTQIDFSQQLCPTLHSNGSTGAAVCNFGAKCRYSHDIKGFLETKPDNIGDTCYMYTTYGYCPSGIACRFGAAHISSEGRNVINDDLYSPEAMSSTVVNVISKSLQENLRKKRMEFARSTSYLKSVEVKKKEEVASEEKMNDNEITEERSCGPLTDEDTVKLKLLEKKKVFF